MSTQQAARTPDQHDSGASGQAPASPFVEGFEQWVKDFHKYETMLSDVAKISLSPKYKEELNTVEQWFKETTITERTATMYHLLQVSTQDQLRFFTEVIQRLHVPDAVPATPPVSVDAFGKPKLSKLARPPSLNLPMAGSPSTTPTLPTATRESAVDERSHVASLNLQDPATWTNSTNAGNTPLLPLFQKGEHTAAGGAPSAGVPGLSTMNPYTLNMLANAGLTPEAQLLAVNLIMSGIMQPAGAAPAKPAKKQPPSLANWRTPTSARFPASALPSSRLRQSALKSAGLKSAGLQSAGLDSPALDSPKPEDFEPEMLNDIPGWFRGLRLHKYTSCFEGLTWQQLIMLDDAALEARGVLALGARRRLVRTFEIARKCMDMDDGSTTPTSTVATKPPAKLPEPALKAPHSAVPLNRSKLSINSPIFTPTWESPRTEEAPVLGEQAEGAAAPVKEEAAKA